MHDIAGVIAMLIFAILLGLLVITGFVLIKRGLWPHRYGEEPHCRSCGYLLVGIASKNCPECGTALVPNNIVFGQRHRSPSTVLVGAALLIFPGLVITGFVTEALKNVQWNHFKPTFMVMQDMQSVTPGISMKATAELDRREKASELSARYEQQLVETGLAQQATTASGTFPTWAVGFVEQLYSAGKLTEAQKSRFARQSVVIQLQVRPIVVLGDQVPFSVQHNARVISPDFYVHVAGGGNIMIDGKLIRSGGSGCSSGGGLGGGGSFGSSVECNSVGKHQLTVTVPVELRRGQFDAGTLLFKEDRTLSTTFEVVAHPSEADFRLIDNPKLAGALQASIQPTKFYAYRFDRPEMQFEFSIKSLPTDVAFSVFGRIQGREFNIGSLAYAKGTTNTEATTVFYYPNWAPVSTQPTTFDLILRSSRDAGRSTVDLTSAWNGILVYPNIHLPALPAK